MSIIVRYTAGKNPGLHAVETPDGVEYQGQPDTLPGVPLRSLDAADLAVLPAHLIRSIPLAVFYAVIDREAFDAALADAEKARTPAVVEPDPAAAEEPAAPPAPRRTAKAAPTPQE
jgi:hypothetical protein